MIEITLKLDDPAKTVELLKQAARYAGSDGWDHLSASHARWLADKIDEQVKNPTVRRFCSLRSDCRMADGHEGGCQP